jgi:hypothetical protein
MNKERMKRSELGGKKRKLEHSKRESRNLSVNNKKSKDDERKKMQTSSKKMRL